MSTFYMPPRGDPGSPVFDPDNVRSLLGFFDDLEFCFESAGIQDDNTKKQHATRYAPDSEKTIWRSFPEFADRGSDYDAFKKVIIEDYIGGSLFSIHDLTSLVEATAKASIPSIKAFGEYSRKFRDIASSLVSSGYLRDHERDHLFLQGIEDSLRQEVYSINDVMAAAYHILDSAIIPVTTAHSQSELLEATQALAAAKAAFCQLQQQSQFLYQTISPISTVSTTPTSRLSQLPAAHPRPPVRAPAYSDFVPHIDYERRLVDMRRQLAVLEQQHAVQRAASHAASFEDHCPHATDSFDMQTPADRSVTPASPRSEACAVRLAPASKPAAQYSRFKLPTVNVAVALVNSASEPVAPSRSTIVTFNPQLERPYANIHKAPASASQDRVSTDLPPCLSTTANLPAAAPVSSPPIYHPPAPIRRPPVSALFAPAIPAPCPVYHHSTPVPSLLTSRHSSVTFSSPSTPARPPQVPHSNATHPTLSSHSLSDVPTPPSIQSPIPSASPPSPTTPPDTCNHADSDNPTNSISKTSSPAKPFLLSPLSALTPCPVYHHSTPIPSLLPSRLSSLSFSSSSTPARPPQVPHSITMHPMLISHSPSDAAIPPSIPLPIPSASPPSPSTPPDTHENTVIDSSISATSPPSSLLPALISTTMSPKYVLFSVPISLTFSHTSLRLSLGPASVHCVDSAPSGRNATPRAHTTVIPASHALPRIVESSLACLPVSPVVYPIVHLSSSHIVLPGSSPLVVVHHLHHLAPTVVVSRSSPSRYHGPRRCSSMPHHTFIPSPPSAATSTITPRPSEANMTSHAPPSESAHATPPT
ncbi:hypothetical protein V8D89_001235 [Ganoderma adspersum]